MKVDVRTCSPSALVRAPFILQKITKNNGALIIAFVQVATLIQNVDPKVLQLAAGVAGIFVLIIGFKVSFTLVLVLATCLGMLGFASFLANWVLAKDEGSADMAEISNAIRDGAEGYFATQYGTIGRLAGFLCAGIFFVYLFRAETPEQAAAGISKFTLALLTAFSFLLGAGCSGVAGYVGMWVSVRANVRVAGAARRSAREALVVALRAGGFSGMIVVALMVLGIALLYSLLHMFYVSFGALAETDVPLLMVGYGFGASFVALFAQLGGGIYTKAADVGADLVGKVEQGIPEDDPRNPAVIADLVGDNVGDCSARGADLFESIAAEVISAMILGGTMAKQAKLPSASGFILFPLVVHTLDLVVSAAGIMSVAAKPPPGTPPNEDPYTVMKVGSTAPLEMRLSTLHQKWPINVKFVRLQATIVGQSNSFYQKHFFTSSHGASFAGWVYGVHRPVSGGLSGRVPFHAGHALRPLGLGPLLWVRAGGHRYRICLRVDRAVLHRLQIQAGTPDWGSIHHGARHQYHRGHVCWAGSHGSAGAGHVSGPRAVLLAGQYVRPGGRQRRRVVWNCSGDNGHVVNGSIRAHNGHFRPHCGQRGRHCGDVAAA